MDCKLIEELIKTVSDSKLDYFELSSDDFNLKMKKKAPKVLKPSNAFREVEKVNVVKEIDNLEVREDNKSEKSIETVIEANGETIKSPMVGTVYLSSAPDKDVFVSVGTKVTKGQTVCIIEAMKLMNEIESEFDGTITEILIQNEQMVEYGQPMFKIKKEV